MDNGVKKIHQTFWFALLAILAVLFLLLSISAILNKNFVQKEIKTASSTTICPIAGIGDKVTDFERAYGKMIDKDSGKSFNSNKINILFLNDIVYNLTVRINSPKKLSIEHITGFLPSDMKIIKEYSDVQDIDGKQRYIIMAESEMLRAIFPNEQGKFVIVQRIYINRGGGYNHFAIAVGNHP